jgi:RecB family exonuclease
MSEAQQLGLDGMPRRLFACTPSRLGSWLDCPRRYRMAYLDRPSPVKGPPWAHNSLGATVHNALAGWWRLSRERRDVAAAGSLVETGWIGDGFRDDEQASASRLRAREMVEGYVAGLDPADEPLGVERTVAARTDTLALSGRIDRLDDRPSADGSGELVVVDYKTGRYVPTTDDVRGSLALAIYAAAAARTLRRVCRAVELHHLPTGRVVRHEHTPDSLARQIGRAEAIGAEAALADARHHAGLPDAEVDAVFPPRPSPGCSWCDFRRHCPEGAAMSPERQPWDAIAEPVQA